MKRAMLEVVASGVVATPKDVNRYIQCTLLAATEDFQVGILNQTSSFEALMAVHSYFCSHDESGSQAHKASGIMPKCLGFVL